MTKKALIFGANGQDGSFLAELLLDKGYEVHGMVRRTAIDNLVNLQPIADRIQLHYGDLTDSVSIQGLITEIRPAEIYNEADQDHAGISFEIPAYNYDVTGAAVGRILEIVRRVDPEIRYFQPVTSNMFGRVTESPQNEETPLRPLNPYACAKVFALHLCRMYREVYGMKIGVGIFYNHESERRAESYVTRKITRSVARIKAGRQDKLVLGDMSAQIDWGYAKEYMEAAWLVLQQPEPDDFIIGTGEVHSVKDFVTAAFEAADLDPEGLVESSAALMRPSRNDILVADTTKARDVLGFSARVRFDDLVKIMVNHDLELER